MIRCIVMTPARRPKSPVDIKGRYSVVAREPGSDPRIHPYHPLDNVLIGECDLPEKDQLQNDWQ